MPENKAKTLGELVDKMIRLYAEHKEIIREQDEDNPVYKEYRGYVEILNEYEHAINHGLRPGFSARIYRIITKI